MRVIAIAAAVVASAPMPTLVWSTKNHFGSSFAEMGSLAESKTVSDLMTSVMHGTEHSLLQEASGRSPTPKSVVVFLDDNAAGLPALKQVIAEAGSGMSLPNADFNHEELLEKVAGTSMAVAHTSEDLASASKAARVTVVGAAALQEPGFAAALNKTLGDDYVAMYTTQSTGRRLAASDAVTGAAVTALEVKLMVSPSILSGLLCGVLWLILFFTGFCCLFAVQTPVGEYEKECLKINKEY
mmetsp:Transcript_58221/g.155561  ORF Transcript_58221/g.155561 Transcript_58221/m.155561 type:complete len:241 (-) Transcript_58221:103-825(-)